MHDIKVISICTVNERQSFCFISLIISLISYDSLCFIIMRKLWMFKGYNDFSVFASLSLTSSVNHTIKCGRYPFVFILILPTASSAPCCIFVFTLCHGIFILYLPGVCSCQLTSAAYFYTVFEYFHPSRLLCFILYWRRRLDSPFCFKMSSGILWELSYIIHMSPLVRLFTSNICCGWSAQLII